MTCPCNKNTQLEGLVELYKQAAEVRQATIDGLQNIILDLQAQNAELKNGVHVGAVGGVQVSSKKGRQLQLINPEHSHTCKDCGASFTCKGPPGCKDDLCMNCLWPLPEGVVND